MPQPEDQPHPGGKDLIYDEEKDRRDKHHHKDHRRGDHGLLAARPRDAGNLLPDLLKKFDWTRLRHKPAHLGRQHRLGPYGPYFLSFQEPRLSSGRSGGARTPNPRFWRPVLYQLSYTPMRGRYFMILATTPASTVRPPSRIAKRSPSSIAIGTKSSTSIVMLSPGITISVPSGSVTVPVTSVVRK